MTDRELLELAAKAYWGDEIDDVCSAEWSEEDQAIAYTHGENQDHNGLDRTYRWNPLEEDGDALPLAVKLMMSVEISEHEESTYAYAGSAPRVYACEMWLDDKNAATRRAIVRAAAELGKVL